MSTNFGMNECLWCGPLPITVTTKRIIKFSVEDPQPKKKKEAPLTVEAGILGRGVRLHPRYAKLTLTWKQKFASPGRSGAFREVRGVKDAMAARGGPAVFFRDDGAHRFWGPRSHGGRDVLTARNSDAKIKSSVQHGGAKWASADFRHNYCEVNYPNIP